MLNAIGIALSGLQNAAQAVNKSAEKIVDSTTNPQSDVTLAEGVVDLKLSEAAYKANIKTLEAVTEIEDEVLNILDKKV